MDMTEKQLSSEYKFRGRIMTARVDEVSLPNGKTAPREVCEHVGWTTARRMPRNAASAS